MCFPKTAILLLYIWLYVPPRICMLFKWLTFSTLRTFIEPQSSKCTNTTLLTIIIVFIIIFILTYRKATAPKKGRPDL